jgi:uncharacterized protein YllA (UPF0747 family)
MYELRATPLNAGPLARAVLDGTLPREWNIPRPRLAGEWRERIAGASAGVEQGRWLDELAPALNAHGAARTRLESLGREGVVVTTGQQPGLFGGPLYTWYKALTALALADELQRTTGVPVAPIFWAATDDTDYAEARWTAVSLRGGARMLRTSQEARDGVPMIRMPLGDVTGELAQLREACAIVASPEPLEMVEHAYTGQTAGGAYVQLLRDMLAPLGIAVLDGSHPAVRRRAARLLRRALSESVRIADTLRERDAAIRGLGMSPQVHEVPGLSLVFNDDGVTRQRISIADAPDAGAAAGDEALSPNVLLRPVVERFIFPTVAYAGGPGEIAYFAQTAAVAQALDVDVPLVVPRWSGIVVEEHVRRILERCGLSVGDLAAPHEAWNRLARNGLPEEIMRTIDEMKRAVDTAFEKLRGATTGSTGIFSRTDMVDGARAGVRHRIARFERRVIAAAKRRDERLAQDIATARGALFPLGKAQERALNVIPFLARHGADFLNDVREAAATLSRTLVQATRGDGESSTRPQQTSAHV